MKKDSQIGSYLYRLGVISGIVSRLLFVGTVLAVRSVGVLIVCFVNKLTIHSPGFRPFHTIEYTNQNLGTRYGTDTVTARRGPCRTFSHSYEICTSFKEG